MKVLIDSACGRDGDGIASSLFWVPDTEAIIWISHIKPLMDMFDELRPDIVIADWSKFGAAEMAIASQRYPHTKLVAIGDPQTSGHTGGLQPDLSISDYGMAGTPYISFGGGAMIGNIGSPQPEEHLKTDLLCITDYIADLDHANIILSFLCDNYNIKIFGKQKVNFPHYLGQIDQATQSQALMSTVVYVDLDGDSWHDAAWLGKQCVSISGRSWEACIDTSRNCPVTKSCSRHSNGIEELQVAVDEALEVGEDSAEEIKMMMKNKTYFELTNEIFSFFGLVEQRSQLTEKKRELTC